MKKRILALLLALTLLVLGGCTVRDMVQVVGVSTTTLQELADAALSDETEAPESGDQFVTTESPEEPPAEAPQDEVAPADEVSETTDTVGEHTYYLGIYKFSELTAHIIAQKLLWRNKNFKKSVNSQNLPCKNHALLFIYSNVRMAV